MVSLTSATMALIGIGISQMNNAQRNAIAPASPVGGRLTLASLTPILLTSVSAAATIYFTPLPGAASPTAALWNGTAFVQTAFAELSQALSDATKSPSAAAASNVYDMFLWSDAGTLRCTRGPAWSAGATAGSNTARGSGAGSTALTRVQGIPVNAVAITNGPAAGYGTYLGTIATDSSGATVSWTLGNRPTRLGVWNMYNRVPVVPTINDTGTSHTPGSSGNFYTYNGSQSDIIAAVIGLVEDNCTISGTTVYALGSSNSSAPNFQVYCLAIYANYIAIATAGAQGTSWSLSSGNGLYTRNAGERVFVSYSGPPILGFATYTLYEAATLSNITVYDTNSMAFSASFLM